MAFRYLSPLFAVVFFASSANVKAEKEESQRHGMIISCPMYGQVWGSETMRKTIREVRTLGVNSIQIHPYGRIKKNGQVQFTPADKTGYLGRAVKIAREEKIELFWKPHLAYWGSFSWRGAITFETQAQWKRFFDSYEAWILDQARFAANSKLPFFVLGTELDRTIHRPEWRRIIKNVRHVYHGQLTYAANWDAYQNIPFWKELDLIGIQAYFPVGNAGEKETVSGVRAAWNKWIAQLEVFARKKGRKIVLTELGYTRSTAAAQKPWDPKQVGNDHEGLETQKMLLDVALTQIKTKNLIAGTYLWKWLPGYSRWERDFSMREPQVQAVIRRRWR
jgi:hypothetical protein